MSSPANNRIPIAILGSGNIATDLLIKTVRKSKTLQAVAFVGVDPNSEGLARAARLGIPCTAEGLDGLLRMENFADIRIVFDATSAAAHPRHDEVLRGRGKQMIDLTPAACGPFCVPVVNLDAVLNVGNVNMVSCGGQATIPIVAAVSQVSRVYYAEIVSSVASRSAGPGTRANIDEFTETTAHAIEKVGGAERGKAIIVLNPAEPPLLMRNTVYCLCQRVDAKALEESIHRMILAVQEYVPGYRLKQAMQIELIEPGRALPAGFEGLTDCMKVSVFLEVEGSAHYLPAYAGNLDIMTSAALATAERLGQIKWG